MDKLISPHEAETLILQHCDAIDVEKISLHHAFGRQLREDLHADRSLPPFDRAMMDGICFHSSSLQDAETQSLQIAGLHAAGSPEPERLAKGSCWEIMTGALVPSDCDTLINYESVSIDHKIANFSKNEVIPSRYIHKSGSDFAQGDKLLSSGNFFGSRELAVAATVGASEVVVSKLPRIAIITTGDELVEIHQSPAAHQIRQSNGISLLGALHKLGLSNVKHQHVRDDLESLKIVLSSALQETDIILLCGGISKGKKDFVGVALNELLGKPLFHGIAQRPGKPLAFWSGATKVFALPGNPLSVLVTFHRYVLPALANNGLRVPAPMRVALSHDYTFKPPLSAFIPAIISQNDSLVYEAELKPVQNSGDFATAIGTDGFIELAADQELFAKGTILVFRPWL